VATRLQHYTPGMSYGISGCQRIALHAPHSMMHRVAAIKPLGDLNSRWNKSVRQSPSKACCSTCTHYTCHGTTGLHLCSAPNQMKPCSCCLQRTTCQPGCPPDKPYILLQYNATPPPPPRSSSAHVDSTPDCCFGGFPRPPPRNPARHTMSSRSSSRLYNLC
jgi:hypothetical protein